ncbi:Uncharacterised protein [Mycobacteroides abscessus subsp. massiliense]|nr:Uncharacterised protein [Mycobacteroides abscessus subsp. massiliense]
MALREDEHIVSTAILGPLKLKKYDILFAIAENGDPTASSFPLSDSSTPKN